MKKIINKGSLWVGEGAVLGCKSVEIVDGVRISEYGDIEIGDNVTIGSNSTICWGQGKSNTVIQDNVIIAPQVHIAHASIIKKGAILLGGCRIAGSTIIEEGAKIGVGACIRHKITVGKNSVIGIGAVVTKNVPEGEIWIGNPAKFYKKVSG